MATAPQTAPLPLFYKQLAPLNSRDHGSWRSRTTDKANWLANQHVVPLTVEEFAQAQRHYPIIFSAGDNPVPLALMGMNEASTCSSMMTAALSGRSISRPMRADTRSCWHG